MSVVPAAPGPELAAPGDLRPAARATSACCRFCGAPLQHIVADLGMSPPSNAYRRPDQLYQMEPFYPLRAYVCQACFLVQLEAFESPEAIFTDYAYFSSYADSWLAHARQYVEMITPRLELGRHSRVIEVACNDGYLLQYFVARGIPVLGVEPAANIAPVAEAKGIPVWVRFFGRAAAAELAAQGQLADLIVANNVVAHVPDLNDFVGGFPLALKPAGVVTHPAKGHATGTLVHGLLGEGIGGGDDPDRPGIVHRLDRDTSGLLLVARTPRAHRRLQRAMRERRIDRRYLALVHGAFPPALTVDRPVGRDPRRRTRMSTHSDRPRDAVTHFRLVEAVPPYSLVEARLETGRTHQVRVHLESAGHPVVGDPVYGRGRGGLGLGRQFLHAARLVFPHPDDEREIVVESPLPPDLEGALARARAEAGAGTR